MIEICEDCCKCFVVQIGIALTIGMNGKVEDGLQVLLCYGSLGQMFQQPVGIAIGDNKSEEHEGCRKEEDDADGLKGEQKLDMVAYVQQEGYGDGYDKIDYEDGLEYLVDGFGCETVGNA